MLRLEGPVWNDTLVHFRRCGQGRRECVVLWTGPLDAPGSVDVALHPEHSATPMNYRVNTAWLHRLHLQLFEEHRTIRAQVHTHKGAAFHSVTDDTYPAVNVPGFLSLVLPRFALGQMTEEDMWLAELGQEGGWRSARPSERIEGIRP